MRHRTAGEYEEKIDWAKLSPDDVELVKMRLKRMRDIDEELFALKSKRRGICDFFLSFPRVKKGGEE